MNELNVFNTSWLPWKYSGNWIKNFRMLRRQFKWAYQRVTRGFADIDWYDMDHHLNKLIAQMLRKLADEGMGYPGNKEFPTPESWKNYLYKIIYLLNYAESELENPYEEAWMKTWENKPAKEWLNNPNEEDKEITNKYLDYDLINERKKEEARHEAWMMLDKAFPNCWD